MLVCVVLVVFVVSVVTVVLAVFDVLLVARPVSMQDPDATAHQLEWRVFSWGLGFLGFRALVYRVLWFPGFRVSRVLGPQGSYNLGFSFFFFFSSRWADEGPAHLPVSVVTGLPEHPCRAPVRQTRRRPQPSQLLGWVLRGAEPCLPGPGTTGNLNYCPDCIHHHRAPASIRLNCRHTRARRADVHTIWTSIGTSTSLHTWTTP